VPCFRPRAHPPARTAPHASAGTVDIAVHAAEERGGEVVLAEAVAAAGALCGSAYVNERFAEFARAQVGAQVSKGEALFEGGKGACQLARR
jgi:hypothetical protein